MNFALKAQHNPLQTHPWPLYLIFHSRAVSLADSLPIWVSLIGWLGVFALVKLEMCSWSQQNRMYKKDTQIHLQSVNLHWSKSSWLLDARLVVKNSSTFLKPGYSTRPELLCYSSIPYGDEGCVTIWQELAFSFLAASLYIWPGFQAPAQSSPPFNVLQKLQLL